ncbi:MAG: xanthine dehydrogenase family protein molybdopterin-binding subunit [Candidatus Aminicenantes bacterium]|nr:MAG: xanthine dehydrogenase family protein molybdopterin-binding subunit [Candidatus Aminicenantes bacterium]
MKDDEYNMFESVKDIEPVALNRREFLKLMGGGIFILFSVGSPFSLQERRRRRGYPQDFNAYLRIGEDGRVTCFSAKIEMGQGVVTSLAQMLAEELDVPLSAVDMIMGDTALCPWDAGTFGSRSTKYFGPPLRQAGAEAKAVLIQLAAEHLRTPREKLIAKDGIIYVKNKAEKKVSYGQLAKGKKIERYLEKKPSIKHYSKHTVSGKPTDRLDGRQKITGEARFAGDIRLPGMLYARILRPPAHRAKLKSVDISAAQKIKDVQIIHERDMIAVLHKHRDVADKALGLIKAEFETPEFKVDNNSIFKHLKDSSPDGSVVTEAGNLDEGKGLASKTFEEAYFNHYVAHAPAENHTAVVKIEGDKATVWASTQAPFRAQGDAAQALGFSLENVRVITPFVGCGFGGKNSGRQVGEAALLAKLTGKPVQVAWSRKEEFFYDTFRPAAVIEIRSGLNSSNQIVYWDYHNYFAGNRSSQPFYSIPHHRVLAYGGWGGRGGGSAHPFGVGAWRGPGSNTNVFAIESHIEIMAERAGINPLEFRMKNLTDKRMQRVLMAAAEKFGRSFSKAPSGKGFGLACTDYLGTYLATMAKINVDKRTGEVRAERVVCAQDTGEVINPEGVRMQIEGCIIMGLGYCLTEEIRFKGGRVLDENFDTYEIPRFSWTPKIETVLVDNPEMPPQGCGEPAITPMGAVIANAIFDAIGVRLFVLPMTPARIKEAMKKEPHASRDKNWSIPQSIV